MSYAVTYEEGGLIYSEIVEGCSNPVDAIYSVDIRSEEDVINVIRYRE